MYVCTKICKHMKEERNRGLWWRAEGLNLALDDTVRQATSF